jgi:uncharacterized membrane protein
MDTPTTAAGGRSRSGIITGGLLVLVVAVVVIFAFNSTATFDNWYALFKVVHVTFAVVWIGGGVLITILAIIAERSRDPEQLAAISRQAALAGEKIFAPAGFVVLAMGIAMMLNTDWGWGTFWVDAGLVGYAATFLTGVLVLSPLAKKIERSVHEKGAAHPDTLALIPRILLIARFDVALLLLVVADMVTKPFS